MISNDEAKQLGLELTEKHKATVLGIAKQCIKLPSGGFHITSTKAKAVRSNGIEVSLTCCRGDLCEMKNGFYPLVPPLSSAEEWTTTSKRITMIHQDVCSPNITWLITDPAAAVLLVVCGAITYGAWIGTDEIAVLLQQAPRLDQGIETIFGSVTNFGHAVYASFWFAFLAHLFEAGVAMLYCRTLNLQTSSMVLWMFMVFLVGFPVLKELQALVKAQEPSAESRSKKS